MWNAAVPVRPNRRSARQHSGPESSGPAAVVLTSKAAADEGHQNEEEEEEEEGPHGLLAVLAGGQKAAGWGRHRHGARRGFAQRAHGALYWERETRRRLQARRSEEGAANLPGGKVRWTQEREIRPAREYRQAAMGPAAGSGHGPRSVVSQSQCHPTGGRTAPRPQPCARCAGGGGPTRQRQRGDGKRNKSED